MHFMFNLVCEAGYFVRSLESKDKLFEGKLGNGAMIMTCLQIYLQNTVHTTVHNDPPGLDRAVISALITSYPREGYEPT